ncbi:hypothetical protein lerEdw1_014351 [Lerista edwardsae]|nr:hypothetical protein lerEdw1_014351 [Lerista edwardsae]
MVDEKMAKFNCTVSEVTVMNLKPEKKPTLILPGDKNRKGLRSPSFHRSSPNLAEPKPGKEDAEKVSREGATSPKPFYGTEAQSMDSLALKRPVKLAPLEIPLEIKDAQLQKIMTIQRDAQLAAFKLASVSSISSEPHVKRVKNLAQVEMENLQKIKTVEKATLDNQDGVHSSDVAKPLCEVQIILPLEGNSKPAKKPTAGSSPVQCRKPLIPPNMCNNLQAPEDAKLPQSPLQGNGRQRFRLKQMKEQQECLGKTKPLKAMGAVMEDGKLKMAGQRTHKTLSDATKLIENVAKKHRGKGEEPDEIDEDPLVRRQSTRRMAHGDIILVDEE